MSKTNSDIGSTRARGAGSGPLAYSSTGSKSKGVKRGNLVFRITDLPL